MMSGAEIRAVGYKPRKAKECWPSGGRRWILQIRNVLIPKELEEAGTWVTRGNKRTRQGAASRRGNRRRPREKQRLGWKE